MKAYTWVLIGVSLIIVFSVASINRVSNSIPKYPPATVIENQTTPILASQTTNTPTSKPIFTPTNTSQIVPSQTPKATQNSIGQLIYLYRNTDFGFELQLTEAYKDYRVQKTGAGGNQFTNILIEVPVPRDLLDQGKPYPWYAPFYLQIFSRKAWTDRLSAPSQLPVKFNENSEYIFTYIPNEPYPSIRHINFEVPRIISTFRFIGN